MQSLGKMLLVAGVLLFFIGIFLIWGDKIPYIGKLPGDIIIRRENFTFYFPITTLVILNVVLYFVFWIIRKFTGS